MSDDLVNQLRGENGDRIVMSHWHYQLMYHKYDKPVLGEDGYYAVHEYYEMDDGDGWTENPVTVDGNSVEDVKKMLLLILKDIDKHGVKDYESDQQSTSI